MQNRVIRKKYFIFFPRSDILPCRHHSDDDRRQHPGDHLRLYARPPPHHAKLLHRLTRGGGSHRIRLRAANERCVSGRRKVHINIYSIRFELYSLGLEKVIDISWVPQCRFTAI